jgi:hypothetical protein
MEKFQMKKGWARMGVSSEYLEYGVLWERKNKKGVQDKLSIVFGDSERI